MIRYIVAIDARFLSITHWVITSTYKYEGIFEGDKAWVTSGCRRIDQWRGFDVITVQLRKLCKSRWVGIMLETI